MGLSSAGIGSGLDVTSIVSQLMASEQQPLTTLATKQTAYQAQLTAYGTVSSGLSTFRDALNALSSTKLQAVTATPGDATVLTATGGTGAVPGDYSIEVTQLAQTQKLVATGQTSNSATIGTGTLTFDFGTTSRDVNGVPTGFTPDGKASQTVTIDAAHNTLAGIRDAINQAKIGVTASIVNDGSGTPYRLTLSSATSGEASSMRISVSGDTALSDLVAYDPAGSKKLTETIAAQNAKLKVNGIDISKASNSISDAVPGVTLALKKTNAGSPTTLAVAYDTASVTTAVSGFVDAFNKIDKTLKDLSSYNQTTKKGAALYGDSTIRSMRSQLRSIITSQTSNSAGSLSQLNQVGIEMQTNGTLKLNSTKLQTAIETQFDQLPALFADAGTSGDSQISYASSTSNTKPGSYAMSITQLATRGNLTGNGSAVLTLDASHNSLDVTLDGTTASVSLTAQTYASADALAAEVQTRINGASAFSGKGAAVTVSASNGVLSITSNRYGSNSQVELAGSAADLVLGGPGTSSAGVALTGSINGVAATSSGQTLTGATGDASEGLKIKVTGGAIGARGNITFSRGFASQLDQLAAKFLDDNGSVSTRTDGINSALKKLDNDKLRIQNRLDMLQKQYEKQFTALDSIMSKMNSTSSYLTAQLASL